MPVTDGAARSATAGLREHGDLHPRIWPLTACALAGGEMSVGGVSLAEIAACYGTPVYVLDEADVRQRCRGYRQAFGDAEIAYAGKEARMDAKGVCGPDRRWPQGCSRPILVSARGRGQQEVA